MYKKARLVQISVVLLLSAVLVFSGWQVLNVSSNYAQAESFYQELQKYKPTPPIEQPEIEIVNQSVIDLKERYPDTVGWLTVNGTTIEYPFVQAQDNDQYLRRDMDGNYLVSGTLFLDYRSSADFTDFTTVIYGHHMKNSSMFGDLKKFRDKDFFDENQDGYIYLSNQTYRLEIAAMVIASSTDGEIYRFGSQTQMQRQAFIEYIRSHAEHHRELELTTQDRFVILSSCAYDYDNARMILIARLSDSSDRISEPDTAEQTNNK